MKFLYTQLRESNFIFLSWLTNKVQKIFQREKKELFHSPWNRISQHDDFRRNEFAMAVYKDRFVLIAGGNKGKKKSIPALSNGRPQLSGLKTAGMYDMKVDRFTVLPDLPLNFRSDTCGGVIVNDHFYVYSSFSNEAMYRLNLRKRRYWELVTQHLPEDIRIVTNDHYLFALGGSQNYVIDPKSSQWLELSPMNKPRHHFACAVLKNQIYVIGGYQKNDRNALSSVEIFDLLEQTWKTTVPLPKPLAYASASVIGKWLVVTGGGDGDEKLSKCTYIFDTKNKQWIKPKFGLYPPRMYHETFSIENKLMFVGGCSNPTHLHSFGLELIEKRHLLPNLEKVQQLVLLRHLAENERAFALTKKEIPEELEMMQKLVLQTPSDVFRHIMTFVA